MQKDSPINISSWMDTKEGAEFIQENHDGMIWDREHGYLGIHGVALALGVALDDISTRAVSRASIDVLSSHIRFQENLLSISLRSQHAESEDIYQIRDYVETHTISEGNFEWIDVITSGDDMFVDMVGLQLLKELELNFTIDLRAFDND